MKIGVFFPDTNPQLGGANSLLKTIQEEIKNANDKENEYFFLYQGSPSDELLKIIDGFSYLNLNYYSVKESYTKRIKNKIKKYLRGSIEVTSQFDIIAEKQNIDLFWFPSPYECKINYPYIFTVWDLGHRQFPYFPEVSRSGWTWEYRESCYQNMLFKASYIITGNEEGKKEILTNYSVPANKVRIAQFPVASFCYGKEQKPSFDIPEQFFFYPAQFWPHKNHIRILEALVLLREKYNLTPVVFFTGSDKGNKQYIEQKIKDYRLENQIRITGFLEDEELKYLYTHATAMIFASLMGPNNMPPIEATFLNCPVIITDLEGHKEQLGDTALFFNGLDEIELAEKMKCLLDDNSLRESLKNKEKELAKDFDKINYFSYIKEIINEFSLIRKTWGQDYKHL